MRMSIIGVGHFHPENVIDNAFLESLDIGTNDEWILERTGIETRRTVLPLDYIRATKNRDPRGAEEAAEYSVADLGEQAAKMAIQKAGILPSDIGMIIAGVSVPEVCIPAHACLIGARLGIKAPGFDLNSACSAFGAQMHFVYGMKPERLPDFILIVQSETYTMATNYEDRRNAVLFGDGAAAAVISTRGNLKPGQRYAEIVETVFNSNPEDFDKVGIPASKHFFQEGNRVQRFAILQTEATYKELEGKAHTDASKICFIGHQANLRMLQTSCQRIGVLDDRHYYNVNMFGNCGAAGAPSVLSQNWDAFKEGDHLAMVVVGSGLSWGGSLLRFGEYI